MQISSKVLLEGNSLSFCVISNNNIIEVIGLLTIAVRYPDIDNITNKAVYFASKKLLNNVPSIAPWIKIGRNIPPATPEVNDISENKVFIKYNVNKKHKTEFILN